MRNRSEINRKIGDTLRTKTRLLESITDDEFVNAVQQSTSYTDLLKRLRMTRRSEWMSNLRERCVTLNCFNEVWDGFRDHDGLVKLHLVLRKVHGQTSDAERPHLKAALLQIGRPYVCEECKLGPTWNGKPLTLAVDHRDGDRYNHLADNLRFLCPNCHTQTDTYCSKNIKRNKFAPVAQRTERSPSKRGVSGSNPLGGAEKTRC